MNKVTVRVEVNGEAREGSAEPRMLLVDFLRDLLGLTGTHVGCDTTNCGACTIMLDGRAVKSCSIFAVQANGRKLLSIEGLSKNGNLHPIQEGFWEKHGLQCGYCTPGMIMGAYELLKRNPMPTEQEIRRGISGNLCRCTGYVKIVEAVQYAAERMREEEQLERKSRK